MHTPTPPIHPQRRLARQVRERLVEGLCAGLTGIDKALMEFLNTLMSQTGTQREMQNRRDAWQKYQQCSGAWLRGTMEAWREALTAAPVAAPAGAGMRIPEPTFELVDDDVVENKILASRMALPVLEQVSAAFEALRLRVQALEGQDLPSTDILRPEAVALRLVDSWGKAGLPREDLQTVLDPLQRELATLLQTVYQACNDSLQNQGIDAKQDLRVRRPPTSGAVGLQAAPASRALEQSQEAVAAARARAQASGRGQVAPMMGGQGPAYGMPPSATGMVGMSGMTPLARARQRAHGVMGQLRRLLTQPATGFDMVNAPPASAALAHALAAHRVQAETYYSTVGGAVVEDYSPAAVVQLAGVVRNRATEFKKKADTQGEKAIIEVVALMFQSILAEDRIPPAVRVWFARLQVPGLRGALAEPEVFSNLNHPARQLIDRMGSCALGFDATSITGSALETEIKRIVQVIEQYPETGRRVFQLVYDEFEKFLAKFLTEKQATSRLVSVAQQVEQKETLAIQSLPGLLQRLRQGLALLGIAGAPQDAQIKALTDTLAEAFLSKTAAIPMEHIEAMARRLENLEDFIGDAEMGDLPLDAESIEMMTGIDASAIHVVADNGAPVDDAMVAWAQELQLGNWFTLDHNGSSNQVQYAWHSQRKQLHLFAATNGRSYLIQLRRLGAYLQAGLLVAREEEGLTVRATRDALAKLNANPERLLG